MPNGPMAGVIAAIYQAGVDDTSWQEVVERIAEDNSGIAAALMIRRGAPQDDLFLAAGYPVGAVQDFLANHVKLCPWNDLERDSKVGVPYFTEDVIPVESIAYSRFYKTWIKRYGMGSGFGVKICEHADCHASLVLDCALDVGKARRTEFLELLASLTPHLQRAVEISRKLMTAHEEGVRAGLTRTMDAVAIVDANAVVVEKNATMESLIARGYCSAVQGGRLRLPKPDDTARLMAHLLEYEDVRSIKRSGWPRFLAFEVASKTSPNVIEIEPLSYRDGKSAEPPPLFGRTGQMHFIVTIRVRSLMGGPSAEHIRDGMGLTPKQAEAVWALVNGETIDKQAQERGLSVDGVRWHFKNIYQRTGCSNQAELVRLVTSLFGKPILNERAKTSQNLETP